MNSLPKPAWWLGYGGLIPFALITLLIGTGQTVPVLTDTSLARLQASYAAIILGFLGAISWGVVMAAEQKLAPSEIKRLLIYSVLPALLGWFALFLPVKQALFALAVLILLAFVADSRLLFRHLSAGYSADYAKLRLHLTTAVAAMLVISALLTA